MAERILYDIPMRDGEIRSLNEYQYRILDLIGTVTWPGTKMQLGEVIKPAGSPNPKFEIEEVKPE